MNTMQKIYTKSNTNFSYCLSKFMIKKIKLILFLLLQYTIIAYYISIVLNIDPIYYKLVV